MFWAAEHVVVHIHAAQEGGDMGCGVCAQTIFDNT